MVFRESRVVDEVWAGVAPRALAGEALLIVLGALRRVTGRARRDSNRHRTNQLASTACAPSTRITPSAAASPSVLSRM